VPGEANVPDTGRWRLKDTEITLVEVEAGSRKGEWLFSPETVARAGEFYEDVKHLPYVPGSGGGAGYREPWLERNLPPWAAGEFAGLRTWQWLGLLAAIFVGLTMRAVAGWVGHLIARLSSRTKTQWDERLVDALRTPVGLLAATGVWFIALYVLRLRGTALTVLTVILQVLLSVALTWMFYRLVSVLSDYAKVKASRSYTHLDEQLLKLISTTLKTFVVIFGILLGAQNLGIEVFSVLAGLGIGGLAVALAAKDTLANFFGSVMIMLDRPFQVGHWVRVGSAEGIVEDIGFRTTKIRTFYNSLVSIPNSMIATDSVDNMGLRRYRRVMTTIGITYDTPAEKVEAFLEGIKNVIKANEHTRKDYFHVVFNDFGPSSLNILLYFFLDVPDWGSELLERQNVLLEITRLADRIGVDFAFPTQTVHVETFPEKQPLRGPHEVDADRLSTTAAAFRADGAEARPAGSGLFVPSFKEDQQD
jgi:MscS family membrane protein